jgi:hypothetical protein
VPSSKKSFKARLEENHAVEICSCYVIEEAFFSHVCFLGDCIMHGRGEITVVTGKVKVSPCSRPHGPRGGVEV